MSSLDVASLWEAEYPSLCRYFEHRLGDWQQGSDFASETFARVVAHADSYTPRPGISARSWLYRIAKNLLADHYRARRTGVSWEALAEADLEPSCTLRWEEVERRWEVAAALDALPPKQRASIYARFWEGRRHRECGHIASLDGSKKLQDRALVNLRRLLKDDAA